MLHNSTCHFFLLINFMFLIAFEKTAEWKNFNFWWILMKNSYENVRVCVCVRMRWEAFSEKFMRCRFLSKRSSNPSRWFQQGRHHRVRWMKKRMKKKIQKKNWQKIPFLWYIHVHHLSSSSYLLYHNFILSFSCFATAHSVRVRIN